MLKKDTNANRTCIQRTKQRKKEIKELLRL